MSFPSTDGMARACAAGADYVLVATSWPGFSAPGLDLVRAADPGAVVFDDPDSVVFRTQGSPLCTRSYG